MILIGLGSSLPFCGAPPQETLRLAIRSIGEIATIVGISRFYIAPAWPDLADPPFVNAAIAVETAMAPKVLLAALHRIEAAFGRCRDRRNAPRTLDLDLLAYGRVVLAGPETDGFVLPHPALADRDFVLAPLCDIAPDWLSPASGRTAMEMLAALETVTVVPLAA